MDYKRYTGVGVMLGDGLIGIDLDHVIDSDGQIKDWAQKLIDQAPTRKSAHPEPACTSSPRPTRKPSA